MTKNVLITGANGFIARSIKGGKRYYGPVDNLGKLYRFATNCIGIIHLAAVSDKRLFEEDPIRGIRANLLGLACALEVAFHRNLWFIFASTYQHKEKHLYGLSKLMGEELCRIFQKRGMKIRILRLPIVYGPGSKPGKVVARMIASMKNGIMPKIETEKKFYFAYVKDVADLIENEVSVMKETFGRKHTIRSLRAGIMECLKRMK